MSISISHLSPRGQGQETENYQPKYQGILRPTLFQLEQQRVSEDGGGSIQGTVFDETISKLSYLESEMAGVVVESVVYGVRDRSRGWRRDVRWWAVQRLEEEVTPEACAMLQVSCSYFYYYCYSYFNCSSYYYCYS